MKSHIFSILVSGICSVIFFFMPSPVNARDAEQFASGPDLIPRPLSSVQGTGTFRLDSEVIVYPDENHGNPAARYLVQSLRREAGIGLRTGILPEAMSAAGEMPGNAIILKISGIGSPESYGLEISEKNVLITGADNRGLANGIATFRQLVLLADDQSASRDSRDRDSKDRDSRDRAKADSGDTVLLPCCTISDAPEYGWRGVMLDVARHFFTVQEVKELLDLMALYKLNKFHWHLTDDQGWRIEIRKYPLLTEKGAWRHFDKNDRQCMALAEKEQIRDFEIPQDRLRIEAGDTLYGGYYTQEEIRGIVRYAAERGIDIIPEIDVPGHSLAAISNYPWLACDEDLSWGKLFSCPMCPGKDEVLEFCRNVYSEIFELFPYEYVHVGGDEVDMSNWTSCPDCQKRISDEGLDSPAALQSWFIGEMEDFFTANGRKLIGWDEIIGGGLSGTSTVMWWQGWTPGPVVEAAAAGTEIIACPNAVFYLSYPEDSKSLGNIYDYDRTMAELFGGGMDSVKGFQANVWSEQVPSRGRMLYKFFPGLLAVSELCWSSPEVRSMTDFEARLQEHYGILDSLGVGYRMPDIGGFCDINAFVDTAFLEVTDIGTGVRVFYTTDGSIPDMTSEEYTAPVAVTSDTDFTLRLFGRDGRQGEIYRTQFVRQDWAEAVPEDSAGGFLADGLNAVWYDYPGESCREIESAPYRGTYRVADISIPEGVGGNIGLVLSGYVNVPEDGIYTFRLLSDDGSLLYLDGDLAIDNDGGHTPIEITAQKALRKGLHEITVKYFDHNGGLLGMSVYSPDGAELPSEGLYYSVADPESLPRPSASQLAWHDAEMGVIFHYDLHVFDGEKYSQGSNRINPVEDYNIFFPEHLDTDQWIRSAKAAGAKFALLTATHETGFGLWQSDVNPYCMKALKWKNGKGDIVRDFVRSCRKYGLKPGLYVGIRWNSLLGIHNFKAEGDGEFAAGRQQWYRRYCERMVTELCTKYGDLFMIWFDGGADDPEGLGPDVEPIVAESQPECLFYHNVNRADVRWGGSETGTVGYPCWSSFPYPFSHNKSNESADAHNELLAHGDPDGKYWVPAMADTPLRGWNGRHEWFWEPGDEGSVYPLDELMDIYERSAGRNATLIVGLTPDADGLLPQTDAERLEEWGREIERRYGSPLAGTCGKGRETVLSLSSGSHGKVSRNGSGSPAAVNCCILSEDVGGGERVRSWHIEARTGEECRTICRGTSIGHKRIVRFDPVPADELILVIDNCVAEPLISGFSAHYIN